jgi:hypothetical protein
MDMHGPLPEPIHEKFDGIQQPARHIPSSLSANGAIFSDIHQGFWTQQPNTEHWRQYATPAATPVETHAELPHEDQIHVDIAPEEQATEHSNWEMFIHQLGESDKSSSC